jgi:hypothetical protein
MSLVDHAERELDLLGMEDDGDMNGMMRKHILHMVKEFADEGHSGFSGSYAIQILEKLLKFEPVTPLTGEDWEWHEISRELTGSNNGTLYQNARCGRVFKDDDGAYDIEGKVFWDWFTDENTGEKYKSYYTGKESRVPVIFPYTPTTIYEETPPGQK